MSDPFARIQPQEQNDKKEKTMYSTTGYLLEDGCVVTLNNYEAYFKHFVKIYAGYQSAEFVKVEHDTRLDQFVLEYTVPADTCGLCEEEEVTEGLCYGHTNPNQDFINYKTVDLYLHS